jgi:hypothetical protein
MTYICCSGCGAILAVSLDRCPKCGAPSLRKTPLQGGSVASNASDLENAAASFLLSQSTQDSQAGIHSSEESEELISNGDETPALTDLSTPTAKRRSRQLCTQQIWELSTVGFAAALFAIGLVTVIFQAYYLLSYVFLGLLLGVILLLTGLVYYYRHPYPGLVPCVTGCALVALLARQILVHIWTSFRAGEFLLGMLSALFACSVVALLAWVASVVVWNVRRT